MHIRGLGQSPSRANSARSRSECPRRHRAAGLPKRRPPHGGWPTRTSGSPGASWPFADRSRPAGEVAQNARAESHAPDPTLKPKHPRDDLCRRWLGPHRRPHHAIPTPPPAPPGGGVEEVRFRCGVVWSPGGVDAGASLRQQHGRFVSAAAGASQDQRHDDPKEGGGQPLEVDRCGREVGLDLHIGQVAADSPSEPMPGLGLAMEALRAPAVAAIETPIFLRPPLAPPPRAGPPDSRRRSRPPC